MATIKTELTTNEFLMLYSDSQWVRDFSDEGVEVVLAHIEEMQQEYNNSNLDWSGFFMEASEYKPALLCQELFKDYGEEHKDNVLEISEQLNLVPERYTDPDDEDNFDYDRYDELTISQVNGLYQLIDDEEFQQEFIELMIDNDIIQATQLNSKNWVILTRR